jgi:hypothetical protein
MRFKEVVHFAVLGALVGGFLVTCASCGAGPRAAQGTTFSDSHIALSMDKLERVDSLSASLRQALNLAPNDTVPAPPPTDEYVVITLTVKKVIQGHLVGLGDCILRDAAGKQYKSTLANVAGIQFLENTLQSPYWIVNGARAGLLFQIPKTATPTQLAVVYLFKEAWDGKSKDQFERITSQNGSLEIRLLK